MQDFVRQKNIENLRKQLAGEQLDAAQRRFAERMLAEELAKRDSPCIPRFKERDDRGGSAP
ncbi:hypothetical protein LJ725_25730 [Reyranella aquatilis]|jgi:hypothetical protein|uniref:Uncharacterized protein n=1 Tax=Reyranella aquatilis TaxID=2035356 RepID=A0ABS8L232_9HYPH|nr:hypothetical protein [Reyranella aquatilis]MCC8432390.1 hypothetical protein [Reyranella aquatilis]